MIKIINHLPPPYDEFGKSKRKQRKVAIGLSLFIVISIFLLYVFAYQKKAPVEEVEVNEPIIKKAETLPKLDEKSDDEVKIITEEIKPNSEEENAETENDMADEAPEEQEIETEGTFSDKGSTEEIDYTNEDIEKDAFLFPSDSVLITEGELEKLDDKTVELIKNEIYARHGYIFTNRSLKKYFESFNWYEPSEEYSPNLLNPTEKANLKTIKKFQSREK
ncbi:MAG: YARHG domain-containing protein [Ezakiella sp.]|uniref:YARHG domain-containing protein n=1 Tax=Ezakiella sp. TaxID=1935205 RepID=UPI00297867BB|nr:YARHG domain-containing protein [Ezakiella sp.]MDD7731289.1 YARHG domain-containing protein [Eubacteriales bacterium]MDY6079216.1 YARHG domain-containing protein [Ezakiella sp.]